MRIQLVKKVMFELKYLKISPFIYLFVSLFPVLITFFCIFIINYESSREFAHRILQENSIVEDFTFVFLFSGGIFGLIFLLNIRKFSSSKMLNIFLLLFSSSLIFIAMEEIAWGQQFFKFKTPTEFIEYNAQKELTLHNINALQGKSEIFRILFGLVALFGVFLNNSNKFKLLSVPYILVPFVFTILVISIYDLWDDYYETSKEMQYKTHLLSELMEMLIGLVSLLYIILLKRKITFHPPLISKRIQDS